MERTVISCIPCPGGRAAGTFYVLLSLPVQHGRNFFAVCFINIIVVAYREKSDVIGNTTNTEPIDSEDPINIGNKHSNFENPINFGIKQPNYLRSGIALRRHHYNETNCICSRIYDPVCASNDRSYFNLCQFECAMANAKNNTVKVLHQGNCIPF